MRGWALACVVAAAAWAPAGVRAVEPVFAGDRHLRFEAEDRAYAVEAAADPIAWPASFTLEAWVRLTAPSPYGLIAGRPMADRGQDPFYHVALAFEGPDGLRPALITSTGAAGSYRVAMAANPMAIGDWVHVAGVRDAGGQLRLYVDGVLAGSAQSAGPVSPTPGMRFSLGGGMGPDGLAPICCFGNFALRDVKLWQRALTPAEIDASAGNTLPTTGLLRHWPLSEGRGARLASAVSAAAPLESRRTRWLEPAFLVPRFRRSTAPVALPTQGLFALWPIRIAGQTHFMATGIATPTFPETRTAISMLSPSGGVLVDSTAARLTAPASSVHVVDAVSADFDGDGRDDLVLADSGTDTPPFPGGVARLFMQQADGRLHEETAARLPTAVRFYVSADARDFDGDGDIDLLMCAMGNSTNGLSSALWLNNGSGVFAEAGAGTFPPEFSANGRVCQQAQVVDADGDGDPDVIASLRGGPIESIPAENRDRVLINDGSGRFTMMPVDALPPRVLTPQMDMMAYATGDFDGDGLDDVVASGSLPGYEDRVGLQMFRSLGNGRFEDRSPFLFNDWPDNAYIFKLDALDFDGDGRMDLLARANLGYRGGPDEEPRVVLMLNRGEQWVPMSARLGMDLSIVGPSAQALDADGDGDIDLAFATALEAGYLVNEGTLPASLPRPPLTLASGQARTVRLMPGEAHERISLDVPPTATEVRFEVASARNVDLHVARRPFDAGPELPAAPPRVEAVASATTASGNEVLVLSGPALLPGRWFLTPTNADGSVADVVVRATITQSGAVPALAAGHFYNPSRSGHGVSYEYVAGQRVLIWYTYHDDGSPIWYYAQAAAPSPNRGTWSAPLLRFHWHGSGTTSRPVGTVQVTELGKAPGGADQIVFSWNLNGEGGSETMQRLGGSGCPAGHEGNNGMWYAPSLPGYGYTVTLFPNYEFMPVYLYDAKGNPRWVSAEKSGFTPGESALPMFQITGFCPWCVRPASLAYRPAGTLTRRSSGGVFTGLGLDASFGAPVAGSWVQDRPVSLLTASSPCVVP